MVAIELGDRNMVFEFTGQRLVELVQQPQRGVAVGDRRYQHTKTIDVGNLRKTEVFTVHLLVNGIQSLFPPCNSNRHVDRCKRRLNFLLHLLNEVASPTACFGHSLRQNGVSPWTQVTKRQILQFAVSLVQAQTVGNRGVNFDRFRRNSTPFAARHIGQGPHIVRSVRQLDQDNAHVARHGQQHFAKGFRLVFFAGVKL